jgi:putative endopeptidase
MPSSIDVNNFNKDIKPTDDFFRYVNGGWLARNPIPADEARWGSFYTLRFEVEQQLKKILDELAAKSDVAGVELAPGSDDQKVRDFYREAMDIEKRNRLGVAPLAEVFKKIDLIAQDGLFDHSLAKTIGELHRLGIAVFWSSFAGQDERQSDVVALQFWQGGLGLPDRDYYLNDDEKNRTIRADYIAYMKDMLARAGVVENADTARVADAIMAIEMRLARASLSRVELRDVEKMYNKVTLGQFAVLAPKIDLAKYFEGIPALAVLSENNAGGASASTGAVTYLIVGQPKFFTEVNEIFDTVPLEDVKMYLRWQVLNGMAGCLTEELEQRAFEFYGRTFSGAKEMKPLWRRALRATDSALDELVGTLYVARHFPEEAKRKIKDLVDHLIVAYRARIEGLDWMSEATKQKAIEKLGTVSKKLGYPDVWKDYAALVIGTDSFAANMMRASAFEFDRKMREVGGPVNREEWLMPPQLVNAYYMPPMNEIAFPAAILQPPFFDGTVVDGDDVGLAINYGGIGSVIGHELTHGFDDQGSRFDLHGNLKEWWTAEDKVRFDASAAHLAEQFDQYEPLPGAHINGKLTLGENLADLGGLLIAYDALKLAMGDRFSREVAQNFFMGYATSEREHSREEILRLQLQTDPHSPGKFRVNGPMSNLPQFYEAFDVREGDKLWRKPEDRVKIW